jgi:hypothetical protein
VQLSAAACTLRFARQTGPGDVLMATRLDRLARSTRDLLNTLAAITGKQAGFRSLADVWADTTTPHPRLMLTVLGGLAEFEKELSALPDGYVDDAEVAFLITVLGKVAPE